jgi:glycosyltransferase involved in cell wall biosynthesis
VRIGYLVSQYPAPSHTFIRREVSALRRRGLHVDTFSIRPGECLSPEDREEQARTFYVLPVPLGAVARTLAAALSRRPRRFVSTLAATLHHRLPGPRAWIKSVAYFVEAMRLAEELERRGVTHVHNHFSNPASNVGLAASRYLGIGWSVSLHGLSDFGGPMAPLLPEKLVACRFAAVASEAGRRDAMRRVDRGHRHKLHVVRCGIEVDRLPRRSQRAPPPGGPISILAVGRLSPEKAHVGLIEAFALAIRSGVDARLVLIGGGPEEARIRAAVERQGVGHRVELLGRQPEAAVLQSMARADLFVLSSLHEGLPVVLMEALALELPVIAPEISGIPELVVHDETGLLFSAGDWMGLADCIRALAADPERRARLAAAGRAKVLDEFDVSRCVEPLVRLFGEGRRAARSG